MFFNLINLQLLVRSSTISAISFRKTPAVATPATATGPSPDRAPTKPWRLMRSGISSSLLMASKLQKYSFHHVYSYEERDILWYHFSYTLHTVDNPLQKWWWSGKRYTHFLSGIRVVITVLFIIVLLGAQIFPFNI